jgi:hypothetical protein
MYMLINKLCCIGFIVFSAAGVSAQSERVVLGYPSVDPSVLIEATTMTCNGKKLLFERSSRGGEGGVVRRDVSLKLDGKSLDGKVIELLRKFLDRNVSLVATKGKCYAIDRDAPETFSISVMYQWVEPDATGRAVSLMCGQVNIQVDPRFPADVKGKPFEWLSGSIGGANEEKPAHILCL